MAGRDHREKEEGVWSNLEVNGDYLNRQFPELAYLLQYLI
jgi:hypothetical protein